MRGLTRNIHIMLAVFAIMFAGLILYSGYSVYKYGEGWMTNSHNTRLAQRGAIPGDILDRDGVPMAGHDSDGIRQYSDDREKRYAWSHITGDTSGMNATGADRILSGYILGFHTGVLEKLQAAIRGENTRGSDVVLAVDAGLQRYAWDALQGHKGAVIVMNYKTGETYTMASRPGFDPEDITEAIENDEGGFVQRCTQGLYTPGSVFKIVTAYAALRYAPGLTHGSFTCTGEYKTPGSTENPVTCSSAHGEMDIESAFATSCNCYFAHLGIEMGESTLNKAAADLGFGDEFVIKDMVIYSSSLGGADKVDDLGWMSIGQHKDTVTPIHMAMIASAIANGGVMMEPHMLLRAQQGSAAYDELTPRVYKKAMPADIAAKLADMMESVVDWGTGERAAVSGVTVCGKTGTAQISDSGNVEPHAWFVGFTREKPVAIAVVVEKSGSGGSVAAPIAADVLEKTLELIDFDD